MKLAVWMVGVLCGASVAQSAVLSVQDAVKIAKEKSPDIRSLENQMASAEAKARLALSPSEPTLSVMYNDMERAFNLGQPASTVYQLVQPLGFPGKAFLNRSVQLNTARSLGAQRRSMELQVAGNVKTAYYQLVQAQDNIRLNLEQKDSFEKILAIAKRRYAAGAITQVDLLNAQVALYANENDLQDLQSAERAARAQLNVFLQNPVGTPLEVERIKVVSLPKITEEEAQKRMLENRNEIRSARFQAEAADSAYDLAWMAGLPDLQLTLGTTNYDVPSASPLSGTSGATHTYMAGLQITFPLWFLFNEREGIGSASHDRVAAQANLDSVYNQSRVALDAALTTFEATRQKIENYEHHLLPLSEQSLNLALINYSSGKIDFQTLSDTAAARRNTKRDYISAVVTYLSTYTTLGQLMGEEF